MESILKNLKAPSALLRFRGILQCVAKRELTTDEKNVLMAMRNGDAVLLGAHSISQFATAALAFLQILPYSGKDEAIRELIPQMAELATECLSAASFG